MTQISEPSPSPNNHQEPSPSSDSILELKEWTTKLFEAYLKGFETAINKQDKLLDQFEQQLAALVSAYGELAAMMEALVSFTVNNSPEKTTEFFKHLGEARQTMLDTFKYASQQAEHSTDRFTARSTEPSVGSTGDTDS